MKELKLSSRLQAVIREIPRGKTIADIGSDHAYVPCYACLHGLTNRAVAGDIAEGPLQSALEQVSESGLTEKVSIRKGNGLEVVAPGEVDVVVIAGMGGKLIADILDAGIARLTGVSKLILQPNVAVKTVRHWLLRNDWELINEIILEEEGKFYEVLAAVPGDGKAPYQSAHEMALSAGPLLMKERSPIFRKKWGKEITKQKMILVQLQRAEPSKKIVERKQNILKQIHKMEEMLNE